MAARGFDKSCLLQMQDAAFRYAAQSLQNNKPHNPESCSSLWEIVDLRLGGIGHAHADMSPGHIAAYMSAKALLSQFAQRDAMFDVTVLLVVECQSAPAAEPQKRWLARTLADLQRECDRISATTPMFASEISRLVGRFKADSNVAHAMRPMTEGAEEAAADESETEENYRSTYC